LNFSALRIKNINFLTSIVMESFWAMALKGSIKPSASSLTGSKLFPRLRPEKGAPAGQQGRSLLVSGVSAAAGLKSLPASGGRPV
jgi:hypothetical protein